MKFIKNKIIRKIIATLTIIQVVLVQHMILIMLTMNDAKALTPDGNFTDVAGIVPDGTSMTKTDRAPNGTAMVYTAPPTAGGVSNNYMRDYQNNENTILNNYKGVATQSQLDGGLVSGNPHYGSGVNEASVILMQVTGGNRTNMNAITEIVGRNAELIVANPNGINIGGARFINTAKLALVTGKANLDNNGNLTNFDISNQLGSNIVITGVNNNGVVGLGLDVSNVNYVDIVSRAIEVYGNVLGSSDLNAQLNFKTGNHQYDYLTKNVSSDSSLGTTTKPLFALDSSYLGGMYAGRINLIATEGGLGVRLRGDVVSDVADINLHAQSDVEYEAMNAAKGNINITSETGNITGGKYQDQNHQSSLVASGAININAKLGDVNLLGQGYDNWLLDAGALQILAGNNLNFENGAIHSRDDDILLSAKQNLSLRDVQIYADLGNININSDLGDIDIKSDSSFSIISAKLNSKIQSKAGSINISGANQSGIGGDNVDLIAKNNLA